MPSLFRDPPFTALENRAPFGWLPRGHALSDEVWGARHRFMQWALWLHLPLLAAVGLAYGEELDHVLLELSMVAGMAILARLAVTRSMQAIWLSLGLLSCSGMLVHFTGGLIESHFHFFVILPLVALYQDWRPFLASLAFVILHHGLVGTISPQDVYNHPAALADPVRWAFVHAAYVLGLVAVLIFHWKFAESAQGALRASEERFRSSFEEAPIGMCLVGLDGRFLQVNGAFTSMLERDEDELLTMRWQDITHPDDLDSSGEAVAGLLSGGGSGYNLEKRYVRASGELLWGRVAVSVVRDRDGSPLYLISQIEDVTERRRDRERLERLVRSKDEFVASVSHELRTPLTAVVGLSELLRDEVVPDGDRKELVELLADQSNEVSNIVEDLLVAARSEIGTISVAPQPVYLPEQARSALTTLGGEARGRVDVSPGEPPLAWGDPSRIRQILRNLISNALRYGGDRVQVRFTTIADRVSVWICDDGPGIPEGERERIFDPYHRAHDQSGQPASVGLGLTISRQLARLMGGELTYAWTEGESRFELTLPVAEQAMRETPPAPEDDIRMAEPAVIGGVS